MLPAATEAETPQRTQQRKNHVTAYFVRDSWQRVCEVSEWVSAHAGLRLFTFVIQKISQQFIAMCARVFMFMSIYDFLFAHSGIWEYIAFLLAYRKWRAKHSTPSLNDFDSAVRTGYVYFSRRRNRPLWDNPNKTEWKTSLNTRALHRFQLTRRLESLVNCAYTPYSRSTLFRQMSIAVKSVAGRCICIGCIESFFWFLYCKMQRERAQRRWLEKRTSHEYKSNWHCRRVGAMINRLNLIELIK